MNKDDLIIELLTAGKELYDLQADRLRNKGFSFQAVSNWPELVDWREAVKQIPDSVIRKMHENEYA